ncbi:hypothetical protein ABK040_016857 [Willaertia magna]
MYKRLLGANIQKTFSLPQHSLTTSPNLLLFSNYNVIQKRYKKKGQKNKDPIWMRKAGVFRFKKAKYQEARKDETTPLVALKDLSEDYLDRRNDFLSWIYNPAQEPIPGVSELKPIEENSFVKLCLQLNEEEFKNMTVGEIDARLDNPDWDAFEFHLSLPDDIASDLSVEIANSLLPGLSSTPREVLLPHLADLEPKFINDYSKLPKNPENRKVVAGRLVTDEFLKAIHEKYGEPGVPPEEAFETYCLFEKLLSYEKNEFAEEKELFEMTREGTYGHKVVSKADLDRMWEMHKDNPTYWTGERLALEFGLSREQAWSQLLLHEHEEALETGKPFYYEKANIIFNEDARRDEIEEKRQSYTKPSVLTPAYTEEEAYERFLNVTSKPSSIASDDNLPDYVKIPFQHPEITEETEIEKTEDIGREAKYTGYGAEKSRYKLFVAEMKARAQQHEERKYIVGEEDGSVRTMTNAETKFMQRHGTFPITRDGLGGKIKRKNKRRMRQF